MMERGEISYGTCDICKQKANLNIVTVKFPHIDCICHSPYHFERYEVCDACVTTAIPEGIRPTSIRLKDNNLFDGSQDEKVIAVIPEVLDHIENVLAARLPEFRLSYVAQYNACEAAWLKNQNEEELYIILSKSEKGELV